MPITTSGGIRKREWLVTEIYSLDKAFENVRKGYIGIPMSLVELFGPTGVGKTTVSWFFASEAAKFLNVNVCMINIEVYDPEAMEDAFAFYGYNGHIHVAEGHTDEAVFDDAMKHLRQKSYGVHVLDSIGAISPIAELEGESGAANMGRRARIVNPYFRLLGHLDREKPFFSIAINHVHPNLGTIGSSTPGGNTPKYLSANRIRIKRSDKPYSDGSFVIEGTVVKNRFGIEGRTFWLFVLAGYGVHKGMSAVIDCTKLGLLKKEKGSGAKPYCWVSTGEKIPSYAKLIEAAYAKDDDVFIPFRDALRMSGTTGNIPSIEEPSDGDVDAETPEE